MRFVASNENNNKKKIGKTKCCCILSAFLIVLCILVGVGDEQYFSRSLVSLPFYEQVMEK